MEDKTVKKNYLKSRLRSKEKITTYCWCWNLFTFVIGDRWLSLFSIKTYLKQKNIKQFISPYLTALLCLSLWFYSRKIVLFLFSINNFWIKRNKFFYIFFTINKATFLTLLHDLFNFFLFCQQKLKTTFTKTIEQFFPLLFCRRKFI